MFQTFKNAFKLPELRNKILFTLFIVLLYRIGVAIPVPYVDANLLGATMASGTIFDYLNIMSGGALSQATLFALGVQPYINASIIIQLLTIAIPALERLSKEGEEGKKKINTITRYVTVALAVLTAFGYYMLLKNQYHILTNDSVFAAFVIIGCYCAGASLVMWLAERVNEHGIGNGISIILFANIVVSLPTSIYESFVRALASNNAAELIFPIGMVVLLLAMIVFVVHVTNAERRLPVQYAKRQVGRRMYGGQNTYIPMKLNMSGVMPIIFASSIASIPATINLMTGSQAKGIWKTILDFFSQTSPVYMVIYFVLIIAFSYFYLAISFNPVEVANNLKNNGGSVPGIRPGKPTVDYITKILGRITLIGAIFLGIVAALPLLVGIINPNYAGLAFGGSSLLILVSVALETTKEIEAQMTMRHYKGFLE